ncbi:Type IV conjugative transfer system lipoprotein (TraV) [Pseudoalteromonas sp. P1-9]|uniref:TraV family lipoprotein n=1 Tax=Pseudoalteromonas sp. P1-9 TaxID=1710354 RepID=UPI000707AB76|nr:TraV family lipoprotein [Pseudoalteromonas sp. P1-9]KPV94058.1 Type IV conjugative transfer system lipoprotein (TraV) [Pseudoalteromonas sp. P1-9]
MRKQLFVIALVTATSGCSVFTVGEEEFQCSGKPKNSLCKGPMEVYELTNNQDHLEHLMGDSQEEIQSTSPKPVQFIEDPQNKITYVYEGRTLRRQTAEDYDEAKIVAIASDNDYSQSQHNDELEDLRTFNYVPQDIAPEPLAVLEEAQAMRIYVSAWEDKEGDLNIPGYVYVELKPRRWVAGHQADMRPSRVVPFQVIQKSKTTQKRKSKMSKGVDPLSINRTQIPKQQ